MNAFFKSARTVLGTIWVWSLLLVLSCALLVWCFGPLLAVDDHRFWQGASARLVTISVLFLLWGLAMVLAGIRRAAELKRPERLARHEQLGWVEDEQRQVRGRFKEAVHRLKTSPRYAGHNQRWRNNLPWYLLIGEQGSGKTRLLAAAGLQLPFDRVDAMAVAGTAHAEWHFAGEGVLIDTPGRYLTQPDSTLDAAGWSMLLRLLRQRRRVRPLNGVVVALSVETLLGRVGKGGVDIAQVRRAFDELLQRLSGELITRLHQERNVERRGPMLDFPQQAAQLGERLCLFVESAFSAHRYQRISGLRGFYLTCAGDRHSHFVQGLFSRVIFAEADLAGLQTPEQRRIHLRQGLLAMAVVLVLGSAGWLWTHSYTVNQQRLAQVAALAMQPAPAMQSPDDTLTLLALLDARWAATQVFPATEDARFVERAGLYQGELSRPPLTHAYQLAVQQLLLDRLTVVLEEQVRTSLGNRERLLENLRAYLMLNLRERRDTGWLAQHMADHWSARYPGDASQHKRLNEHLARLLEQPFTASLDEALVAKAREELRGESLADVVYRVLREQSRNLEPLRLAEGRVFAGIDPPIPGFYTKRYWQYFEAQGPRLVNAIAQDNWVLGEGADLSAMDLRRLMIELQQRYFSEYADTWSAALGRVSLQHSDSLRQDAEQLAGLTSAQSPLMQLLLLLRENTRLLPGHDALANVPVQTGALGVIAQTAVAEGAKAVLPDSARRALQRRFEPLHQLLDEQHNPGVELTQALRLLDELHLQLAALNRESSPEQAAFQRVKRRMEGQQDVLGTLRDAAARLPLPLAGWFEGMADNSWRHLLDGAYAHVNQRYHSEVYGLYAKAIRQRYPFDAHASSDVALNDFQEFFKPQGVMARFYESYLRPFVSVDGNRYRLRGVDGSGLPVSRSVLDQLTKAEVIRQVFFTEPQGEVSVRFTVAPYSLDQSVSRATLRFGDKQLEYRHGPIVPMVFDWPMEADNGRSSLVLERGTEQRPLGIEKDTGAWSLFRFFDLMQREPATGRHALIFKADLAGLRANYLLTSQRTPSPFDMEAWRTFRLPEQL